MLYVEIETNKVISLQEIKNLNPDKSISPDSDLTGLGYKKLIESSAPFQEGFYAVEVAPVDFVQTWELKPLEVQVPFSITPLQAKLQLLEMELLDDVENMVALDKKISIYWNNAQSIERRSPVLIEMANLLNLSEDQVDQMFIAGSKIQA